MNIILTRTAKVKLNIKPEDVAPTVEAYTTAYNHVCEVGWNDKDSNGVSLHHKTYSYCRKLLPSQLSISARTKATESLKSAKSLIKKGQKSSCPKSKKSSMRYDQNSYSIWFDRNEISISTVDGRKKTGFTSYKHFEKYVGWRRKSADLFIRNGKVFLAIVFEKEVDDQQKTSNVVGVDRGIKKIAVTSDNMFFGGNHTKVVTNRYRSLRKKLQSVGTQSAKRHLRKIREKENRFRRDVNHCVSKKIVNSLPAGTVIAIEDLKNIRKRSNKMRKEQRYWINGWSFYQLENFLVYKAQNNGCYVEHVDARYTSQRCSECGHKERGNRPKQSIFKCKKCGFQLNADLNSSRNIRKNYMDAKGYPCRAAVNQPIVENEVTKHRKVNCATV